MKLPLLELVGAFSVVWWTILTAISIAIIVSLKHESHKAASSFICGFLAFTIFFMQPSLVSYFNLSFLYNILIFCCLYVIGGIAYTIFRWYNFSGKILEQYEKVKMKWLSDNGVLNSKVPEELKERYRQYIIDSYLDYKVMLGSFDDRLICTSLNVSFLLKDRKIESMWPLPWYNKKRLLTWMTYWPWFLLMFLFYDMFRDMFNYILRKLNSSLNAISKSVFKGSLEDYKE